MMDMISVRSVKTAKIPKKIITILLLLVILMTVSLPLGVAAEMLDKYAEPATIASSGSFDASLGTRLDFALSGGELTGAKWSLVYLSAGYSLSGTIKEGEAISLSVTGNQPASVGDKLVFNGLTMSLIFRDAAGRDIVDAQKYGSGNVKDSPLQHQLGGTVPLGTKRVIATGVFKSRWTAGMAVVEEMVSVTVDLVVESGKPSEALPVVTVTLPKTSPVATPAVSAYKAATGTQSNAASPSASSFARFTPAAGVTADKDNDKDKEPETGQPDGDDGTDPDKFSPLKGPWENTLEHAGVAPAIVIAVAAAIAAAIGGAIGGAAGSAAGTAGAGGTGSAAGAAGAAGGSAGGTAAGSPAGGTANIAAGEPDSSAAGNGEEYPGDAAARDPAYERSKVPDYPGYVVGADGERITKTPDGNIEVSYTGGEKAIHFPNGTVQVKYPDGTTREEWEDGTVTSSDEEGFYVKKTDGTLTHTKPNGEEAVFHPDGTSTETTEKGMKITRNESGEVVTVEFKNGGIGVRHPEEPDAILVSYPDGNKLIVRTEQKWVYGRNEEGRMESKLVDHHTFEGEIRTEGMTIKYKPDGSAEGRADDGTVISRDSGGNIKCEAPDGSTYEEYSDGSVNYKGADGTHFRADGKTGEVDGVNAEGGYIKANTKTGELDAKLPDGSYWKRDTSGNGSFVDKETGARGDYRSDGYSKIENDSSSISHEADGTMEFKTKTGIMVTEKPDGTVTMKLPDGRSSLDTPEGTTTINMPDGTVFRKQPDGLTQISKADGSVQNYSADDFEKELARYNDWYNKQLEKNLSNRE